MKSCNNYARGRGGFTLLEMLVVIVVMAILMGVTFRMMKPSEHARSVSTTVKRLNIAQALIAEYHAEYGIYPPVSDPIQYKNVTRGLKVDGESNSSDCGYAPGVAAGYLTPTALSRNYLKDFKPRDPNDVFCFGLASFFINRLDPEMKNEQASSGNGYGASKNKMFFEEIFGGAGSSELKKFFGRGTHWAKFCKGIGNESVTAKNLTEKLQPSAKDQAFYKRVRSLAAQVIVNKSERATGETATSSGYYYYTMMDAFPQEGWGHDLIYICPPPYTSYAIFSAGPDGLVVTDDPLNPNAQCKKCKQYHNKDNVYASVNTK